jgi:biotin carboxyl carrier protein
MRFLVTITDRELEVEAKRANPGVTVRLGTKEALVQLAGELGSKIYTLRTSEQIFKVAMMKTGSEYLIQWRGYDFSVRVERSVARRYRALLQKTVPQLLKEPTAHTLTSHMPGLIGKIFITEGQRIEAGERLWVLEAMKMENEIKAPVPGVVEKIHVQAGTQVEKGQPVCTIRLGDLP